MEFDFISDKNFQDILKRDYLELKRCQEIKAAKSVLILAGSIIEAILSDYFCENPPSNHTPESILKLTLAPLLDFAEHEKLISANDKNLATVLRNFRNLIHPGVEIRKGEAFDADVADIAVTVLELLLRRIQGKYKEKFPTTAEEIVDKLDEDWNFHSVYGIAITKLNSNEKQKLFEEFVEIDDELKQKLDAFTEAAIPQIDYLEIESVKQFVNELEPLLSQNFIFSKLAMLESLLTKGEKLDVLVYYNLLHEEIVQLSKESQEMIAIYMLSLFINIVEEARTLAEEKTYSTIGKYIHTDKGLTKLKELLEFTVVNFDPREFEYQFDVMEQLINSLSPPNRNEVEKHLITFITPPVGNLPEEYLPMVAEYERRKLFKLR